MKLEQYDLTDRSKWRVVDDAGTVVAYGHLDVVLPKVSATDTVKMTVGTKLPVGFVVDSITWPGS